MSEAYKDIGLGLVLFIAALAMHFWGIPAGVDSPGSIANRALAPAFWPRIIVVALGLFSLVIAAQGAMLAWRIGRGLEEAAVRAPHPAGTIKVIVAIALLFVYVWSLDWGGLVVPSMVAIVVFTALHGETRIQYYIPVAILGPVALYYFFLKVALVPMPLGVFEPLFP